MKSNKGWIPVYRQTQDHWLWLDKPFAKGQAWIDLLLLANHKDEKFYSPKTKTLIDGKRGCVYISISELAQRWGWSRRKATTFLGILENEKMVTTKSTAKGTTITIENYSTFNDIRLTDCTTDCTAEAQLKHNSSTAEAQLKHNSSTYTTINNNINNTNHINNSNNINKLKADLPALVPKEWVELLKTWIDIRSAKGAPTNEAVLKLSIKRLSHLAKGSIDKGQDLIEAAIRNGWKDFYELNEDKKKKDKPFDVMDIVIEEEG